MALLLENAVGKIQEITPVLLGQIVNTGSDMIASRADVARRIQLGHYRLCNMLEAEQIKHRSCPDQ